MKFLMKILGEQRRGGILLFPLLLCFCLLDVSHGLCAWGKPAPQLDTLDAFGKDVEVFSCAGPCKTDTVHEDSLMADLVRKYSRTGIFSIATIDYVLTEFDPRYGPYYWGEDAIHEVVFASIDTNLKGRAGDFWFVYQGFCLGTFEYLTGYSLIIFSDMVSSYCGYSSCEIGISPGWPGNLPDSGYYVKGGRIYDFAWPGISVSLPEFLSKVEVLPVKKSRESRGSEYRMGAAAKPLTAISAPFSNTLRFSRPLAPASTLRIFGPDGRRIVRMEVAGETAEISTPLAPGVYFWEVQEMGIRSMGRVVISVGDFSRVGHR